MSENKKVLIGELTHRIYVDVDTQRWSSEFEIEKIVPDGAIAVRLGALTAIVNTTIAKANMAVDDHKEMKQFHKDLTAEGVVTGRHTLTKSNIT